MKKLVISSLALFGALAPVVLSAQEAKVESKAEATHDLGKIFAKGLVDADGKPVTSEKIAKADYVAVYFSAHWCPPCRAFTPKLVEFANEHGKSDKVAFVLMSADRTKKDMLKYMTETKMPWPGLHSSDAQQAAILAQGVSGIPHLRVYDKQGNVVADSVKDGKYIGPQAALQELAVKLK